MSDKGTKVFQSYLANIQAKTGKTPEDFLTLAAQQGLTKYGEINSWLKAEFGLGHGHANAVVAVLLKSGAHNASADEKLDKLFSGKKAALRGTYDALIAEVRRFGPDVEAAANETYVNLTRTKKFALIQPGAGRLDVGIKLRGVEPDGRLEAANGWNAMVTHRVRIDGVAEMDAQVLGWLKQAYEAA